MNQLTSDEQEELVEGMKLQWLRREMEKGVEQADRGELIDGDVVFAELKQRLHGKRAITKRPCPSPGNCASI